MTNSRYSKLKKGLDLSSKNISYVDSREIMKNIEDIIMDFLNVINCNYTLSFNSFNKETKTHSIKIAQLALLMGLALDLSSEELGDLIIGALIHDIGKTSIPEEIIRKPGKLTDSDMELIKKHPIIGYELTKDLGLSTNVVLMILDHHERLDGSGYPANKAGSEINYYSKIISICDVFEAFSSKRCYKPAVEFNIVMDFLLEQKDIQFDSQLVEVFHKNVYPIIINDKKISLIENVRIKLNKERKNVNERFTYVYSR